MELPDVIRLPLGHRAAEDEIAEIMAAIELVASGCARRVVLAGFPDAEALAAEALACAQEAHVCFSLRRAPGVAPTVVVGPQTP